MNKSVLFSQTGCEDLKKRGTRFLQVFVRVFVFVFNKKDSIFKFKFKIFQRVKLVTTMA